MTQQYATAQDNPETATADDPRDPIAAVTHRDPYPYYRRLAVERPLERDDKLGLWVAASAAAVTAVLTSDLFRVRPAAEPVPKALVGTPAGDVFGRLVRMTDGDRHPPLKRAVSAALGSLNTSAVLASAREQAKTMVRDLQLKDDTARLDELLLHLPVQVVASLLGVEEGERLRAAAGWGIDVAASFAPGASGERVARGGAAAAALRDLLSSSTERGPGAGGTSLLGTLTLETERAGCPHAETAVDNGIGFLFQTCDATAGLIGNTLLALARHRKVLDRVGADPEHLSAVIADVLRFDPPVQNTRRFLDRDGAVLGRAMRRGDVVLVVLAAANHDPAVVADPDRFDPERTDRALLSFGAGDHTCPGQTLAATIARAAVLELLASGLDFEPLAGSVSYRPSGNIRVPRFHGAGARSGESAS